MLVYAVKCEYIKSNPNSKIDKPKRAKTNIQFYTPNEVEKIIAALSQEPIKHQAIIMLALDLECRRGKLTGLIWILKLVELRLIKLLNMLMTKFLKKVLQLNIVKE